MKEERVGSETIVTVKPKRGWAPIDLPELWRFRELVCIFVARDVKVKYKQAFLGIAWAVLQPVALMVIFTIFFGHIMKVDSKGLPYPLFVYPALLPWTYFATAFAQSSTSLVTNLQLVQKIYFPRLVLPASTAVAALVDFLFSMSFLVVLMIWYRTFPGLRIFMVLPFVLLAFVCAMGFGMWFSAINVKYRDVQYTIPALVQIWFFLSPVFYSSDSIPEKFQYIYALNPMVAVIEGFRWALSGAPFPRPQVMLFSTAISLIVFLTGAYYFKRAEGQFADVI